MNRARTTFVRVIDPHVLRQKDCRDRRWSLNDYLVVPRISTYGTFNFGDFLSDDSIRNLLKAYTTAKGGKVLA